MPVLRHVQHMDGDFCSSFLTGIRSLEIEAFKCFSQLMKLFMLSNSNFLRFNFIESIFHFDQLISRQMPGRHGKQYSIFFFDVEIQQRNIIIGMLFKSQSGIVLPVTGCCRNSALRAYQSPRSILAQVCIRPIGSRLITIISARPPFMDQNATRNAPSRHAKQGVAVTQANAFGMAYGGLLTLFIHFIKRYRWTANASVGVALVIAGMLVILTPQKPFSRMYHQFYAIRA